MAADAWGLVSRVRESSLASQNGRLALRACRPAANVQEKKGQKD
jgi:hypothetical protein